MKKALSLNEIHELIRNLPVPTATMPLRPSMAAGYKLAKPVLVKGVVPNRPISLVDGLAVRADAVLSGRKQNRTKASDSAAIDIVPETGNFDGASLTLHCSLEDAETPTAENGSAIEEEQVNDSVSLQIRETTRDSKKNDTLGIDEAIPVQVGGEVPRGAQFVYPLSWVAGEFVEGTPETADATHSISDNASQSNGNGDNSGEEEDVLPFADPGRAWDLPQKYSEGWVELDKLSAPLPQTQIQIGEWARNREPLIPEGTILRPGDLALLNAADIDEVVVHRRPVVGVASLAIPFPQSQRDAPRQNSQHPMAELVVNLAKSSLVSAFSFGSGPKEFTPLLKAVQGWLEQVDILVLVGGSHHGPNCLGLDVLKALGEVKMSGADFQPGGYASFGTVGEKTLATLPGTFADVLAGYILSIRPLTHHQLHPPNFADTLMVNLERGSDIRVSQTGAFPIQIGYNHNRGMYSTRFGNRIKDQWIDYVRGQALLVVEADKEYSDGQVVETYLY